MEFEFDDRKRRANKAKHGIDFVEAQMLWLDGKAAAHCRSHRRGASLPRDRQNWRPALVGITYRGEVIQLISVRRARAMEVQAYEGE